MFEGIDLCVSLWERLSLCVWCGVCVYFYEGSHVWVWWVSVGVGVGVESCKESWVDNKRISSHRIGGGTMYNCIRVIEQDVPASLKAETMLEKKREN